MSAPPPRRSSRRTQSDSGDPAYASFPNSHPANSQQSPSILPPEPGVTTTRGPHVPKCKLGQRYKVPGSEFDEESDDEEPHPEWFYGVVTTVQKTGCKMLFEGDEELTRYDGFLESWHRYLVNPDELTGREEEIFQAIEITAKLRKGPKPTRNQPPVEEHSDSESPSEGSGPEEEGPREVDTWESDAEDDENEDEPDVDVDDDGDNDSLEAHFRRAKWENASRVGTDPRAANGAMPENIPPAFHMPSFGDESLLSWFLFYFPLSMVADICKATNEAAKDIAWTRDHPWKHLTPGGFLRWLGIWILMTVYPLAGSRRAYWRGLLNFDQFMPEKRFEQILRAFTLPSYKYTDPEWGGQGRRHYEKKKYDKFQQTRKFTDFMRKQFQKALKPSGWLCIDESMIAWLIQRQISKLVRASRKNSLATIISLVLFAGMTYILYMHL